MKYRSLLMIMAMAGILAAGCGPSVDPPDPPEPPQPPVDESPTAFTATLESISGAPAVGWTENDQIRVFTENAADGLVFHLTARSDSGATFREEGFSDYDQAWAAVYPASNVSTLTPEGLLLELPRTQRYVAGGIAPELLPQVAKGNSSGTLDFKNVVSVLRIEIASALNIRGLVLTSLRDEALWGTLTVAMDGNFPAASVQGNYSGERNSLVLTLEGEGDGNPGSEPFTTGPNSSITAGTIPATGNSLSTTCYLVVPAGTLQEGFRLTVIDERGGQMQKVFSSAVNTERAACRFNGDVTYTDASEEVEIRTDVLNKAFYKDLYLNSGLFLTTNDTLPVADFLGLDIEHLMDARRNPTEADYAAQTAAFAGSPEDMNGRLLYPDGEPRYRMVYVRGGGSTDHGFSLGSDGRERFRAFVKAGGSYLGSCAGAYVASRGSSINATASGNFLGVWPGYCTSLSTLQIYPGHVLPTDSPLLQYYDFGGDFYIDSVRHHNGPCFINYDYIPGTEVLTRFDIPDSTKMHGHPAIIAWKENKWTGRVIPCGSHPEQVPQGENLLLMAAMVRYCFDGVGVAKVKGILHNGETRQMTCRTEDQKPAYTRIGDRQCHHFVFALPEGARNVRVRLASLEGYNLSLRLAKGTFAFKEDAQYSLENTEAWKELYWPTLEAGTWYVGVQCESVPTVTTNHGQYGTEYADTGILNGAPYTISVSWEY